MFVAGILFLTISLHAMVIGSDSNPFSIIIQFLQGILFLVVFYVHLKRSRFIIEFNDSGIDYLIQGKRGKFKISSIKLIQIKLFEVQIEMINGEKINLFLDQVSDSKLKHIKRAFSELKTLVSSSSFKSNSPVFNAT